MRTPIVTPAAAVDTAARDATRVGWLLSAHALVWTVAAWLAWANLDRQGDMAENYVWGIEWQAGYAKHPPLFAWITAAWFQVFPHSNIAYFALSAVNAMVGLHGIIALAGRFLPRRLAVVAGIAMALSPLYSNLAIKFNANAVLLSVWPWVAYYFVRYMQTGGWRSALALGALAGAAMLGKYFSVVLLLALFVCALLRPAWRTRLGCRTSLWVLAGGVVVVLPHLHWLVANHFPTLQYAEERVGGTRSVALMRFGVYSLAQLAYLLPSFIVVCLLVSKNRLQAARQMVSSTVRPSQSADLWCLAFCPLLVVGVIAVVAKTEMASVWGMAQWFAIVPLWLATIDRAGIAMRLERLLPLLIGYWFIVLAATATVGYVGAVRNARDAAMPSAELAAAAVTFWQAHAGQGQAIPIVAGEVHAAEAIAFYSGRTTRYWDMRNPVITPWLTVEEVKQKGVLIVCRPEDAHCLSRAKTLSGLEPDTVEVQEQRWGKISPARQYLMFPMLPQR
jgi:4-amino-4-deoxy-L-arabinose transferase-like glycosyltransferase